MGPANTYSYEVIGRRLDAGLTDAGITPDELAIRLGGKITGYVVREWIRGRTRIPLDKAAAICDILDWPLDRLAVRGADSSF